MVGRGTLVQFFLVDHIRKTSLNPTQNTTQISNTDGHAAYTEMTAEVVKLTQKAQLYCTDKRVAGTKVHMFVGRYVCRVVHLWQWIWGFGHMR